jgi:hypothetical protein
MVAAERVAAAQPQGLVLPMLTIAKMAMLTIVEMEAQAKAW